MRSIQSIVDECFWFHSIDLGNGIVTRGLKSIQLLQGEFENTFNGINLAGKRVLDVGAWNGAFTAEAARRGAAHIAAIDHHTWNKPEWNGRRSFDLVVEALSIPAKAVDLDLDSPGLTLAPAGTFDVVLFLGVFYHLKNPLTALQEVANAAKEVLVVETYVERSLDPKPAMVFFPGAELGGDASNWWGPSCACIIELLKMMGFARIETSPGSDSLRQVFRAWR